MNAGKRPGSIKINFAGMAIAAISLGGSMEAIAQTAGPPSQNSDSRTMNTTKSTREAVS